ncbi:N-acetyltransferase [Peptoniphilus sp. MSJ-1]|uniref:N-acetyltransferase n=1 Tax=Peptoniphilus ovalis TaxID=2841503 RepID=A0ABS6FJ40_9FIRM|nr:GNAT family N-acetyltransferase [Peptoniphilus ovalis]MBU5670194.1 N-acetyltransferase [Peptoniphilus ovalis]
MEVKKGQNCYYIGEDENNYKGILTYVELGDVIDAQHTVVKPEYEGQGIAGELVKELVKDAREEGKRIKGSCSYVARKLENDEYSDVRA